MFTSYLRKKGKDLSTIDCYSCDIRSFIGYLSEVKVPPSEVGLDVLAGYLNHLRFERKMRSNSVRRSAIAVRQFFKFLCEIRIVEGNTLELSVIPAREELLPSDAFQYDIDLLLDIAGSAETSLKASRDQAIIALMAFEGIKASELISIKWPDLIFSDYWTLNVRGKKQRVIDICAETGLLLSQYREELARHEDLLHRDGFHMFIGLKGKHLNVILPKLTRHGLKFLVNEVGRKAKLQGLTSEKLRHFAIERFLDLGYPTDRILSHLGLRNLGLVGKHMNRSKIGLGC